ncbi:IclR family transcriptional regulator [Roseobacteraceae bacterium S113]
MQSSIIQKLLTLLTVISAAPRPQSFSEIVKVSGLNKSTIHRLLAIGIEENLVRYDPENRVYFLGSKVFDLVRDADSGYDIQAIALDEMVKLFDAFEANVTLGIPSGREVAYLRILEAPQLLGGAQRPGMREPVHCTASGKALYAFLPEQVIKSKLKGYEFKRLTSRTIADEAAFLQELARVRKNGFAYNDREEFDHFVGIAAPIFNYLADPIAVLNVWSVHPHHSIKDLLGWTEDLKVSAKRVTDLIGGVMPEPGRDIG